MVPEPPSSPPPLATKRKPSFALGGFPPSTPLAVEHPDPFSFRQAQPETPYSNPWQNLFAQSGAPTPSVLPPDSPFAPVNAVGFGFPGRGGEGRRGSLSHPGGVASGFSNLTIGSPARGAAQPEELGPPLELMGPPTSFTPKLPAGAGQALWPPGSSSSLPLPLPPANLSHPTLTKDANGRLLGGALGGSGRRATQPLPSTSRIKPIFPAQIPVPIPPTWLILDLRTHHLFTQSRIPSAIPITIPSTLLRRPNFTLAKVLPMLASDHDRERVQQVKAGLETVSTILVYDQDGLTSQEGGVLQGLLNKFEKEGFAGELCLVRGGFLAVQRAGIQGQVESSSIAPTGDPIGRAVNGRDLPIEAFQQGSVNAFGRQAGTDVKMGSRSATSGSATATANPGFSTRTTNGGPNSQTTPATQTQAANPFFDNIRQNAELAQGITERIPLDLPTSTVERARDLPGWLRELVMASPGEASEILAMQFYKIELGEQRRLQGIMDHHTRNPGDAIMESGSDSDGMRRGGTTPGAAGIGGGSEKRSEGGGDYFPYSITAGLEKGGKNRFKNIWPFDHARVRLNEPCVDDGSDYINASFIQPRATNKRYIATQGPLPSTYRDFWTLCWEQNVRVIVMLTKQHEGGQVKCGDYWSDQTYGAMKLHPIGVEGGVDEAHVPEGGGFFFAAPKPAAAPVPGARATIKRSFHLTHADYPDEAPRLITQIQYISWPDFDIPEQPSDLLHLIRDVNECHDSAVAEAHVNGTKEPGPVVVHCSAGVGRTGSYVIVDAVLDAIKREMLSKREVLAKRSFDRRAAGGGIGEEAQQKPPKRIHTPPVFGADVVASPNPLPPHQGSSSPPSDEFPGLAPRTISGGDSISSTSSVGSRTQASLFPPPSGLNGGGSLSPEPTDLSPPPFFSSSSNPSFVQPSFNFNAIDIRSRTPSFSSAGGPTSHATSTAPSLSASVASSSRAFSRESSPQGPDSHRHAATTEDGFAAPRRQHRGEKDSLPASAPTPLGEMSEPIRAILEDMRQQRMSLCQTLRQYVFAYRVVIQGILDMVDEDRGRDSYDSHDDHKKRQASPTDLQSTLSKRPSIKLPKSRPRRPSKSTTVPPHTSHPLVNVSNSSSVSSSDLDSIPASATFEVGPDQIPHPGLSHHSKSG